MNGRRGALDIRAMRQGGLSLPGTLAPHGAPAAPGAAPALRAATVLFPPDVVMPPEATYIYAQGSANVGPGPASWTPPAGIITQIPSGSIGVLKLVAFQVLNMLATTDIDYSLRVNGGAVPGIGALTMIGRPAAYVEQESDNLTVRAPENALVDALVTVNDGGTYTVGFRYEGWYYPRAVAERYLAGRGRV